MGPTWRRLEIQSISDSRIQSFQLSTAFNRQKNQEYEVDKIGGYWQSQVSQNSKHLSRRDICPCGLFPNSMIPPQFIVYSMRNGRVAKNRFQWYSVLNALWENTVEPKKSSLTWLFIYRAIWTQKRSLRISKGDGKCARCKEEEDDLHIFFLCPKIGSFIQRFGDLVKSEGRVDWTYKSLLIGDSIGCSNELWTPLRTEILWSLWLYRLDVIFGGLRQNFFVLKEALMKTEENYFTRTLSTLNRRKEKLSTF